jgi:hypothetical protein
MSLTLNNPVVITNHINKMKEKNQDHLNKFKKAFDTIQTTFSKLGVKGTSIRQKAPMKKTLQLTSYL